MPLQIVCWWYGQLRYFPHLPDTPRVGDSTKLRPNTQTSRAATALASKWPSVRRAAMLAGDLRVSE